MATKTPAQLQPTGDAEVPSPTVPIPTTVAATTVDPYQSVTPRPKLSQEYVSSFVGWSYITSMVRALPAYIDDITRDFGTAQYDRMMTDAQVNSVVKILVMAVLADEVRTTPAVDKEDPDFAMAEKYDSFCSYVLANIKQPQPLVQILYDMLEGALTNGHKVAEQIYEVKDIGKGEGLQLVLTQLKPKPLRTTAFVSDPFGNIPGLLYQKPTSPIIQGLISYDLRELEKLPNFMPRAKFAVLTNLPVNGDPRGRSSIRPIYTFWWMKQQMIPEVLKYLARFGSPSVIGYTAPEAQDEQQQDGSFQTPEEVMLSQLEAIRGGAAGAFPSDSRIELLEAKTGEAPFMPALREADLQIAKGVLLQTLATEEGEHMARSASEVHQDVLALLIQYVKGQVIEMIQNDILSPLVRYNYGDAATALTPHVLMGDVNRTDLAQVGTMVAELAKAGMIHDAQRPGIWEMLDLPPVDEEILAQEEEQKTQAQEALTAAKVAQAKAPPVPPGTAQPGQPPQAGTTPPPPAQDGKQPPQLAGKPAA